MDEQQLQEVPLGPAAPLQERVGMWLVKTPAGKVVAKEPDARRERAGWLVAQALGLQRVVRPVVLREMTVPGGRSTQVAVTAWIDGCAVDAPLDEIDQDDVIQAAIFDWVAAHADRIPGRGNWLADPTGPHPRLVLVDQAEAFGAVDPGDDGPLPELSRFEPSIFVRSAARRRIDGGMHRRLQHAWENWSELSAPVAEVLSPAELAAVGERLGVLVDAGHIPDP